MLQELGKKDDIFNVDLLEEVKIFGKPKKYPKIPQNHKIICGFDQGLGEILYVCDTIGDMQDIYEHYAKGFALNIYWYHGEDPGFMYAV